MIAKRLLISGVLVSVAILAGGLVPSAASASTYSVTSTADAGPGTLRQAIVDANAHPGADSVRFNLPGSGVQTIAITGPLPAVSETAVINGRSQPGFAGTPLVRVDNASGVKLNGLRIAAAQSEVLGLELTRFAVAVRLVGDSNRVQGNLIGTDAAGDAGLGNATGVRVESGTGNRIGGIASSAPNVVSGNTSVGIEMVGAATTDTMVAGNRVGTDPGGTVSRPNGVGVRVGGGSTQNMIGGTTGAERNLISGNQTYGVQLIDAGTAHNTVAGNYVGTTADGAGALANAVGVRVDNGASQNAIGGSGAEMRNVISGNTVGVHIDGATTTGNSVAGNYVGTDAAGTARLANLTGIRVSGGSTANTIGGATAAERNVISGNGPNGHDGGNGIEFLNAGTKGNVVAGNYIGVDATGGAKLGNNYGIYIPYPAGANTIGIPGAGNVISGNNVGLRIESGGQVVAANYIGTDAGGTAKVTQRVGIDIFGWQKVRADGNTIGGTTPGARNVISGNGAGVAMWNTAHNSILGNYIGTDATGLAPIGNGGGIDMYRASQNTIGGTTAAARNVISANTVLGIHMNRAAFNTVAGNYIGTDATGGAAMGNGDGVIIDADEFDDRYVRNNTIGGTTAGARNVISGNTGFGVTFDGANGHYAFFDNAILGNYIGTNAAGDAAVPNAGGVHFLKGLPYFNNSIGASAAGARNVISGNSGWGVVISAGSHYVDNGLIHVSNIEGNYFGTKSGGNKALGNGAGGVRLENGVDQDRVVANRIAFNGGPGVIVDGAPDTNGLVASGESILGNSIFNNDGLGIDLINGGNHDQAAPAITAVTTNGGSTTIDGTLDSTASTSFRIELFSSPKCDPSGAGEGRTFLDSTDVTTDGAGYATFSKSVPAVPGGQVITATATSAAGDTSEFSTCVKSP